MRLDAALYGRGLTQSRSQAENFIKLGLVEVNGQKAEKASVEVSSSDTLRVIGDQFVSRAALKLASIVGQFALDFRGKTVLDVGSSTGGFTDYSLQHGARRVIAVDVGTGQLHSSLRGDPRIELHEKTDIRSFKPGNHVSIDMVVADVSFISLRVILPAVARMVGPATQLIIMCKPQFEAGKGQTNKGVVKNSAMRRQILKDFEAWLAQNGFSVLDKADSQISGTKGNVERFYKLRLKERKH